MIKQQQLLLLLLSHLLFSRSVLAVDVPVIGVFTRHNDIEEKQDLGDGQYISAAYIKLIESVGGLSIPIMVDASDEEVEDIFKQINGVLIPGGGGGNEHAATRTMWNLAKQSNENGEPFPIFGVCLGFEIMLQLASNDNDILVDGYNAKSVSWPVQLTEYGTKNSKMFTDSDIRDIISTQNVTWNLHRLGITPEKFLANEGITSMFEINSVNVDRDGRPFVSSMEARNIDLYPFYGVQWHPEKNGFEYGIAEGTAKTFFHPEIDHSSDGIRVSHELLSLFIDDARKSSHEYLDFDRFPLVWNYEIVRGHNHEQIFWFPDEVENPSSSNEQQPDEKSADVMAALRGNIMNDARFNSIV
mmetsp:Transcript_26733/g.39584  ORF Transcript_26733/g.39584 Transcript_26733/m.39584 type:complete len:357 (-) Transcript_26733:3860-4930(-)